MSKRRIEAEIISDLLAACKKADCIVFAYVGSKNGHGSLSHVNASWSPAEVVAGKLNMRDGVPFHNLLEHLNQYDEFTKVNGIRTNNLRDIFNEAIAALPTGFCHVCTDETSHKRYFISGGQGPTKDWLCQRCEDAMELINDDDTDTPESHGEPTQDGEVRNVLPEEEDGLHDGNSKPYTDANGEDTHPSTD